MKYKKLHNINSAGFKTPHDYFESFDEKIISKLNAKNLGEKESKVIQLFSIRNLIYVSSIAAAILLLFNLSIFEIKPTFDTLETETVENYIIDENISSYEIAALLSDEHIDEAFIIDYFVNDDNIEEYLFDNADIEALMIE